jgi:hypothetical protein
MRRVPFEQAIRTNGSTIHPLLVKILLGGGKQVQILHLTVDYPDIPFPQVNDLTIIRIAVMLNFGRGELESIKRCQLYCCLIFLSRGCRVVILPLRLPKESADPSDHPNILSNPPLHEQSYPLEMQIV